MEKFYYDHHLHEKTSGRTKVGKIMTTNRKTSARIEVGKIMTHVTNVSEDRRAQAISSENVYLHRNYSFVTTEPYKKNTYPQTKQKPEKIIMPFLQQHVQTAASIPSSPSNTLLKYPMRVMISSRLGSVCGSESKINCKSSTKTMLLSSCKYGIVIS